MRLNLRIAYLNNKFNHDILRPAALSPCETQNTPTNPFSISKLFDYNIK